MKFAHFLGLSAWMAVFMAISEPAPALDPRWAYHVLENDHFEVIYREDQNALAKRYLTAAEQAYSLLMPIFKEGPDKTYIVLQDDTDSANGLADFLPYPHIVVYPVLPTQGDAIDEYGDWPLEMIVHEYAHILNMYPAHGIFWPFKYLFGSLVRPNAVLPRWYLEGLAVDLESRLTDHGRLRSPNTDAVGRAYFLGDRFKTENISTINETEGKTWPYGARPYLFGAWWWDEAHRNKGPDSIYNLNQNFSRRIPFLLNGPMEEQLGAGAGDFFHQSLTTVAARAARQIESVRAAGGQTSNDVLDKQGDPGAFAVSPSGLKLLYWLGEVDKGSFAYVRERENAAQSFHDRPARKLFRTTGTFRVVWLNENSFLFDQVDAAAPYVSYRDLYRYDFLTETTTRITHGARAQDAAVSPNGKWIAFVQNDAGKTHLRLMGRDGRRSRIVVAGNLMNRIASPEFLDDDILLFTGRVLKGDEKIYAYTISNKTRRVWNSQLTSAQSLRRTPAGMLATDAGTGVRNTYLVSADKAQALSNTFTSIQSADYDPLSKSLVANELTPFGPRLKAIPFAFHNPPRVTRPEYPSPPPAPRVEAKGEEHGYWPIRYMFPRYILPMIYPVEGGAIFQALTTAKDPLDRNILDLSASFDSITNKTSYGVGYQNNSLPTSVALGYSDYVTYLGASGRVIESQDASASLGGHVGSRFTNWSLGGLWSETEGRTNTFRRLGPSASLSYRGMDSPYHDRWKWHAEAAHQQFLEQDGYMAYGRSYAHLASVLSLGRHKVGMQVRGAVAPDLPFRYVLDLGDRSVGGNYLVNLTNSQFLLRGYPSGTFVGRKIVNGNLEWVMPAADLTRGFGTFPLFLRQMELALFADTMAVDGAAYSDRLGGYVRSKIREFYTGAGGEVRLNTSVAYHVPLVFTVGLYYGLKDDYGGGFMPFLGVGLGSLGPISKKTP